MTILLLSIAGVVISVIVGTLWYGPNTPTGKIHMQYLGFDKLSAEEQKRLIEIATPKMPKIYVGQMLLSLLTSVFTVFVITMSVQNGVPFSLAVVFPVVAWLCFTLPATGGALLWGNCEGSLAWKKFFTDIFCSLLTILLIALMVSFFI
jgi:Protein of unknown function (DUF1761)